MNRRTRFATMIGAVAGLVLASGIAGAEAPGAPPTTTTTTVAATTTTVAATTTTTTTTVAATTTTSTTTTSTSTTTIATSEPARSGTVVVTAGCDGAIGFVEATVTAHIVLADVVVELRRMFITSEPIAIEVIGDMAAGSSSTARWNTIGGYTYSVDVVAAGEFVHNSIDGMEACADPPTPTPTAPAAGALPATR